MAVRCLIVDDNAEFSAAARTILEGPDVAVVGEAATAAEALELAAKLDPDLVLVDIDLGDESVRSYATAGRARGALDPQADLDLDSPGRRVRRSHR
jgi:DNA-binding NarL/FixJ family response regulator